MLDNKVILITGGTGSFGREFTRTVLEEYSPRKIIICSRDEFKQSEMAKAFSTNKYPIRYFLGDIRDESRMYRAFDGVDIVVHAAALKQVPALEYNPFEAVKTNIVGAENIANAAIDRGVKQVVALSTDKAVNPINLYGATKLSMEKILVAANSYAGVHKTRISAVRYGNVVGSRGSVIPLFMGMAAEGVRELPLTDERMTRFWITLRQSVELVMHALKESAGGEIFVPKIPSMRLTDLIRAICPKCTYRTIGIRPGEKLHEMLISEDEARTTVDTGGNYVILPQIELEELGHLGKYRESPRVPEGFVYRSDRNEKWLTDAELDTMVKQLETE
jgi:UDP-N-acetylglucosamine 4,6-dehydratase